MTNKFFLFFLFLIIFFLKAWSASAATSVILETGSGVSNFSRQTIFQTLPAGTLPEGFLSRVDIQSQQVGSGVNNPYTISLCQGVLNTGAGQLYAQRHCGAATIIAQTTKNFTSVGTTTVNFLKRYAVHASGDYYLAIAGGGTSTSSLAVMWTVFTPVSRIGGRLCGTNNYTDDYCSTNLDNVLAFYDDDSLPFSWQIGEDYINIETPVSTTTPILFSDFSGWRIGYGLTGSTTNYYYNFDLYATIDYTNITENDFFSATTTGLARGFGQIGSYDVQSDVNYGYSWLTANYRPQDLGQYIATATLWAKGAVNRYEIAIATTTFTLATSTTEFGQSGWCKGICDDLATSSLAADLICAGRMTVCFIFIPHTASLNYISDSYEDIKQSFPFNTFYSLVSIFQDTMASTTLTQNDTLGIPFIRETASGSEFFILPVLASSSMPDTIGQANTNTFKTTVSYILWIATGAMIFSILL